MLSVDESIMSYIKQINGRGYQYRYDAVLGREIYVGAVEPAQSKKDVLYSLPDDVVEYGCEMFVRGYTFADIRKFLSRHGVRCCDATIRKFMRDNDIERFMY